MVTNPDDAALGRGRDGEAILATQADARATDAEAVGDHDTATALRRQAAEHHRRARALDEALRAAQGRRRVELARTLRQHKAAAGNEVAR